MDIPNDCMILDEAHVLRLESRQGMMEGHVIMLNPKQPGMGTHLFQVPAQGDAESLRAAARTALRAFYEG